MNSAFRYTKHAMRRTVLYAYPHLPRSVQNKIVQRRHIKIVSANLVKQTPAGFFNSSQPVTLTWSHPDITLTGPAVGLDFGPLTQTEVAGIQSWLGSQAFDSDANLDLRMDGFHDEVGRTIAALNTRVRLHTPAGTSVAASTGNRILFDARSLQTSVISGRGIGRFAAAALAAIQSADPESVTLLVDRGKPALPAGVVRSSATLTRVTPVSAADFSLFIQPSPMTAPINPYENILRRDIIKVALIYDFIPGDFPDVYLTSFAARAEYCAALDSLSFYSDFVCISHVTKHKLTQFGVDPQVARRAVVAWPESVLNQLTDVAQGRTLVSERAPVERIVVMSGDDPRKNTVGALGAAGAVTSSEPQRDVVVLGMPRHQDLVHHLGMYAAMRPGEAVAQPHLPDAQMVDVISHSGVVLVMSFDEGLSLPVIEALRCGTPVVASDIPAHRELIGSGPYLADPHSVNDMTRALKYARNNGQLAQQQLNKLLTHQHDSLESVMAGFVARRPETRGAEIPRAEHNKIQSRFNVGIATPWSPQASGVADFSTTIFTEMAKCTDLTVYLTDSALKHVKQLGLANVNFQPVSELLARNGEHEHDSLISVVGNSHFHLPFIELLSLTSCVVVAHDTRMIEFYTALRGIGGAEEVMLTSRESPVVGSHVNKMQPTMEEQISDMRLLQNMAMWEIARRAETLIMHSISCKELIHEQTGVMPHILPFAHYRNPLFSIADPQRQHAREQLGFSAETLHIVTFGYVDLRTKLNDQLIAAAGWLNAWGHNVHLTFAGGASDAVRNELLLAARNVGVQGVGITGYISELDYQNYLLAADVGIQLRVSDFLGVSGPLSDLAAFGTTSIGSSGLVRDVSAPAFVYPVSVWASALQLAEEIERVSAIPVDAQMREHERTDYVDRMSPKRYVDQLLAMLASETFRDARQ